jgi:hypothetical protein
MLLRLFFMRPLRQLVEILQVLLLLPPLSLRLLQSATVTVEVAVDAAATACAATSVAAAAAAAAAFYIPRIIAGSLHRWLPPP